ncbi:MAG: leucine-rich repeat domain-containing protein [Promethearchaeia archaeon]
MNITPKKIYEEYLSDAMPLNDAVNRLIFFAQKSSNIKTRIKSINLLTEIGIKDEKVYEHMENLLISDNNEQVRNTAINALYRLFPDKSSYQPLKFSLFNEDSLEIKQNVYEKLVSIIYNLADRPNEKNFLLNELSEMKIQDFRVNFSELKKDGKVNMMSIHKLKDILINYLSYIYLKKSFWRIEIKVEGLSIKELRFIFKGLDEFPLPLHYLKDLNTLILRYNQLRKIPVWISSLTNLEILNLNVNTIKGIPETIGSLKNLERLEMWKNSLVNLPDSIGNLVNLKVLKLRINKIEKLPFSIGRLSSLIKLDCHDNNLKKLPSSMGNLHNLIHLDLSWNYISHLPSTIGNLSNVEVLRLEKNKLQSLPSTIGGMKSLKILHLRENKLRKIPLSLCKLKNLRILNLSNNYLEELPDNLSNLTNLEQLHLSGNEIIKIPSKLKNMQEKGLKLVI